MKETVRKILAERMGPFGFKDAKITAGEDHDGDPVLYIEARYKLSERPVHPRVAMKLISEVSEALKAIGEHRFPHVRHHFQEGQKVVGWP